MQAAAEVGVFAQADFDRLTSPTMSLYHKQTADDPEPIRYAGMGIRNISRRAQPTWRKGLWLMITGAVCNIDMNQMQSCSCTPILWHSYKSLECEFQCDGLWHQYKSIWHSFLKLYAVVLNFSTIILHDWVVICLTKTTQVFCYSEIPVICLSSWEGAPGIGHNSWMGPES